MKDVYLHNPRCSKSRQGLALLRERDADVPVREYLKQPLAEGELRELIRFLGVRPIEIVRRSEEPFKALNLSDATPDGEVILAIVAHPVLLERPILVSGGRAVVGRPTEKLLELL